MAGCDCVLTPGAAGTGPVGAMPFGTMMPDTVSLSGARALTANTVLVPFSGELANTNPRNPWSALNPNNWSLLVVEPLTAVVRLAQHVTLVTEQNLAQRLREIPQLVALAAPPAFVVGFDGVLTQGADYQIELSSADASLVGAGCDCAEFEAVVLRCDSLERDARDDQGYLRDIANPFLVKDALQFPPSLGTYQFTDTGDLANDSGSSGLRKRIFRRVTAAVGDFFHLNGYGAGVTPRLKHLIRVDEIQRIQAKVRAQVLREPEVTAVVVRVYPVNGDQETISVAIKAATVGNPDPVSLVVPVSLP